VITITICDENYRRNNNDNLLAPSDEIGIVYGPKLHRKSAKQPMPYADQTQSEASNHTNCSPLQM
jgi:hypothetical protein